MGVPNTEASSVGCSPTQRPTEEILLDLAAFGVSVEGPITSEEAAILLYNVENTADFVGGAVSYAENIGVSFVVSSQTANPDDSYYMYACTLEPCGPEGGNGVNLPENWSSFDWRETLEGGRGLMPEGSFNGSWDALMFTLTHEQIHWLDNNVINLFLAWQEEVTTLNGIDDLPTGALYQWEGDPIVYRNLFRDGMHLEMFADALAAAVWNTDLLNGDNINFGTSQIVDNLPYYLENQDELETFIE